MPWQDEPFWVVPAIDLMGGRVVRLAGGDFGQAQVYDEDPVARACQLVAQGACRLHVVDLDGAREGRPVHLEVLRRIVRQVPVPVQFGGGLRSLQSLEQAFEAGAASVLVGTRALDGGLVEQALDRWGPQRVWAALDVRDGRLAVAGWQETTAVDPLQAARRLAQLGVRTALVTDTARDGRFGGPNVGLARAVAACGLRVLVAGGVAGLEDVLAVAHAALQPLPSQSACPAEGRLAGVVVGRALYEGRLDLRRALQAVRELQAGSPAPGPGAQGGSGGGARPV